MQLAKQQLETALRSVQRESMMITDSEVADVHYKLGRICWTMGGVQLTDPTQARAHLIAATKEESEVQVRPRASAIITTDMLTVHLPVCLSCIRAADTGLCFKHQLIPINHAGKEVGTGQRLGNTKPLRYCMAVM